MKEDKQPKPKARDKLNELLTIPGEARTNRLRIRMEMIGFRVKYGLSLPDMAKIIEISPPILSKLENDQEDRLGGMTLNRLEELAEQLDKKLYIEFRDE